MQPPLVGPVCIRSIDMREFLVASSGSAPSADFGGAVVAGHEIKGQGAGELLTRGAGTMLVHLHLRAGFDQDGHEHPDHESIGYILSGRVEMTVGDETSVLGPGDTWYHPRATHHTCRALEDAEILEFHAPLRPDVLALFGQEH
jgi:quercetin dioxygenase-like cupin family protein